MNDKGAWGHNFFPKDGAYLSFDDQRLRVHVQGEIGSVDLHVINLPAVVRGELDVEAAPAKVPARVLDHRVIQGMDAPPRAGIDEWHQTSRRGHVHTLPVRPDAQCTGLETAPRGRPSGRERGRLSDSESRCRTWRMGS
ncbi:hypothetical protein TBR22_A00780 [Luteitalea sp. TBR-22]|nr:hypothetical protein TBR22_A00780 [Luteitalea sp. TBR-22]